MPRNRVRVQFKHVGPAPSLAEAANRLGVMISEMDSVYGVNTTDAARSLYAVRVDDSAMARVEAALRANPRDAAEGLL